MEHEQRAIEAQRRMGRVMIYAAWVVLLLLLTLLFNQWVARQENPNASPQARLTADGSREVVLRRNRAGHFVTSGRINGTPVVFLVDTGATDVSLPAGLARRLGLARGAAVEYSTANGTILAYTTRLARLRIGSIELHDVAASINPHDDGDQLLLGMSALSRLDMQQRGDSLTLRQPR